MNLIMISNCFVVSLVLAAAKALPIGTEDEVPVFAISSESAFAGPPVSSIRGKDPIIEEPRFRKTLDPYIYIDVFRSRSPPLPLEPELEYNFTFVNTSDAFGDLGQAESVDLLFLVDVTGSMGSYIRGVKESIIGIVDLLTNDTDGEPLVKNLRLSFVGYRDFEDDPNFETMGFTKSAEDFLDFVKGVSATGGGDAPEDVYGGMERALEQDWDSDVKVLLHIADAPCHGVKCGNLEVDPETSPPRRTPEDLFREIGEKNIRYNFGVITSMTKHMVKYFKEIALSDFPLFDLRVNPGGFGGPYAGGAAGLDLASEIEYRKIGTKDRYGYKVGSAAFGSVVNAIKG